MQRTIVGAALAVLLGAGLLAAQTTTWTVNLTGTSFVDLSSATNVSTIQVGDTVKWIRLNGSHTVTSGATPTSPGVGSLFNYTLNSSTPVATYTPTAPGTIQYHCTPHYPFGMTGTIIVQPPPLYPGSVENFTQGTAVNTPGGTINPITFGGGNDVKTALAGDVLSIQARSTLGTFNYFPLLIVAQFFTTGTAAPAGTLPGLHVNTGGGFLIINGLDPLAFGGMQVVAPGGSTYGFGIPSGLSGQSLMIQSLAVTATAANGFFAITIGHEIRFL